MTVGGMLGHWYGVTGQNWRQVSAEACFRAVVTAKGGSTITAFFKVKK